jgi:DNA-binding transcriptional regulator LsrR (DeoR family)
VNRLLIRGQELGLVEIRVQAPRLQSLEAEMLTRYQLREVRIAPAGADGNASLVETAKLGAALFEESVRDRMKIGVSSGRTIFELASKISEKPRDIEIYPLNAILEQTTSILGVTANATATILWFRCRPFAKAHRIDIFLPEGTSLDARQFTAELLGSAKVDELQKEINDLDVYFLGASEPRPDSRLLVLREQFLKGNCSSDMPGMPDQMVGDVAFNAVGSDGSCIDTSLEEFIFRIEAEKLRALSNRSDKKVVLVASGRSKVPVVKAALAGGLCNVLVTDSDVAHCLIQP